MVLVENHDRFRYLGSKIRKSRKKTVMRFIMHENQITAFLKLLNQGARSANSDVFVATMAREWIAETFGLIEASKIAVGQDSHDLTDNERS